MNSKTVLFKMQECGISKIGLFVTFQEVILNDLNKLEKIKGYINSSGITDDLKIEIVKNIIKENNDELKALSGDTK